MQSNVNELRGVERRTALFSEERITPLITPVVGVRR